MPSYKTLSKNELLGLKAELTNKYEEFKAKNLKLDMSRGKPGADQLDLANEMLDCVNSQNGAIAADGTDCRNYGIVDGLPEAKALFAAILGVSAEEVIVGGNSSLNMMYDTIARAMSFGVVGSSKPWGKYDKIKFLCPAPGYDRHFAICELFGIEMITIEMNSDGPDMDSIEKLVSADETIKGIWCVPKYSNPQGITYSEAVVKRFAALKPAAADFRIFWDNAYCIHDLKDTTDYLPNILEECKKAGSEDMVFIYTSTSKVSYPGAGLAAMAASKANINAAKKQIGIQTIGPDKINQLRHIRYYKNLDGVMQHMQKHRAILSAKFDMVTSTLESELAGLEIASWNKPNGGYFVALDTLDGCAKRTIELCKNAGVVMTPAGATFPYGIDPRDRNIRIAPTYPPVDELKIAVSLFCVCVKLAAVEKLLENK